MPPQTILTTNGNTGKSSTTTATTQNVLKSSKQKQSQNKNHFQPKVGTSKMTSQSPLQKINQHIWPWTTLNGVTGKGTNLIKEMASCPKNNNKNSNKRQSQTSFIPPESGAKKSRINGNSKDINNSASGLNMNSVAIQSLQGVINNKRLKNVSLEESQTKITGYFKSQMKSQMHQSGLKRENTLPQVLPSSPTVSNISPMVTVNAMTSPPSSISNPGVKTTSSSLNKYFNLLNSQMHEEQEKSFTNASSFNMPSLPPTLKKIERSKPTKIAQVAPNLRKTTANVTLSQLTEKSLKKHVAIAPRTTETKSLTIKAPKTPTQQQQPAVLLTAIHIPPKNQTPQLLPTSPRQQQISVGKSQSNNKTSPSSEIQNGPPLYQLPIMPNLVQFPNLIATNVSQLTGGRNNHNHSATATQFFLNGTVFKVQQYTPTAKPTGNSAGSDDGNQAINTGIVTSSTTTIEKQQYASNNNNTSPITANSIQEMFSNEFQQQVQQSVSSHNHHIHHSQPVFMTTTTGLLLNASSLPAMLASAGKQTVAIQPQQIPALQPIQGAVMPGLSSIFNSQEQNVSLDSQIPSLQQQTNLPPLSVSSSAFSKLAIVKAGNSNFTPSVHKVSATQPPPLVTISSGCSIVNACGPKTNILSKTSPLNNGPKENLKIKKGVLEKSKKDQYILPAHSKITSPKSPPALIYTSLISKNNEKQKSEDIFDILKNSKSETTFVVPSSTPHQKNDENNLTENEKTQHHAIHTESSPLLSIDNSSNSTISEESIKDLQFPPECSEASTSESSKVEVDKKLEESVPPILTEMSSFSSLLVKKFSPTVDITLADNETLPKCAISPILSQPKTIRFPAKHESGHRFGPKGMRRHDGVCYWDKCNKKHDSNSKLLDHMQTHHVNTQTGPFACLWLGCKVYERKSCSRLWLERHVLSHGGTKPFKCIVDGCGLRFGSQLALQKHVNGHFTATENKDNTNKRTSDPPVPKLLRKNGKKLRYRRQPFSARMFDFFDTGIMEGLHHRLRQISTLTNGNNCITFRGAVKMRRRNPIGVYECFVEWAPPNITSNEWLPESNSPYIKTLPINRMKPNEKTNVELLLRSAYRLPYSPNLFQSFHSLSRQNSSSSKTYIQSSSTSSSQDTTDDTSRSSSIGPYSVCSNLPFKLPQIERRQKQSRKQPKKIQPS